jgi:hypothetical protein
MPDQKTMNGLMEQQLASAALFGSALLDGLERASRMQHDGLHRFEALIGDALERQRAGCDAMLRLIEQMRATRDPAAVLQAQQEWLTGEIQRFVANAAWWQETGTALFETASHQAAQAVQAGAAAATGKVVKVAAE